MLVKAVKDGRVQLDDVIEPGLYLQVKRRAGLKSNKTVLSNDEGYTIPDLASILERSPSTIFGQIRRLTGDYQIGYVNKHRKRCKLFSKNILEPLKNIENEKRNRKPSAFN
jgi:hypothetical protein